MDGLDGDTAVIATLLHAGRAVGGRRAPPWLDYSRLARARAWRPREAYSARTSPLIRTTAAGATAAAA